MSKPALVRTLVVGVCAASLSGCMGVPMGGMMGMGQPQQAQQNDSGVGSTAGSVAGSQMSDQVPFGAEIGGMFGRRAERAVRTQPNTQAQPAGATQAP